MLKKAQLTQVIEIIQKAVEGMEEDGYRRYCLQFVRWDKKEYFWLVGFHTRETNLKFVGVIVKQNRRGYFCAGRSYG